MKLEIRGEGLRGNAYRVFLDGREMRHVTRVALELALDDVNFATLEFLPDEVVVDAEALAALHAHVAEEATVAIDG